MVGVRKSTRPGNVFAPEMNQVVVDFRFRDDLRLVDNIVYQTTNAALLPTNDPLLKAKFKSRLRKAGLDPVAALRWGRWALWVMLILAALISVLAILWRRNKHKKAVAGAN